MSCTVWLWRLQCNSFSVSAGSPCSAVRCLRSTMRLRDLESALSSVRSFEEPRFELEQYPTSAHLAACTVFTADSTYDDIEGKRVLDLGCGTAMLSIGAQIMGSSYTVGVDVDPGALAIARENVAEYEVDVELVHSDVASLPFAHLAGDGSPLFDTVVMNPPFGTRNKGIDVVFLKAALASGSGAVYSMHKSSTRKFLGKKAEQWGVDFEVVAQMRFDIPKMYKFHKSKSKDIEVDLIRLSHRDPQQDGGGGEG